MKIAFITNYYNHHQKPLADELFALVGDDYYFIETKSISEARLKMGWGGEERPSYVLQSYTDEASKARCQEIVDTADIVIIGSAPYSMLKTRLKKGLLTFIYTERLYKEGISLVKYPVQVLKAFKNYAPFKNLYVLCASAYTPIDFSRMLSFIGKTYKWGYFTEVKKYDDIDELISKKAPNSILWVSRFIALKHPEIAVEVAKRLKSDGYEFTLNMIGNGVLEDDTRKLIESNGLTDCVRMLGMMKPEQVREHMEKSEIFLFSSDRNEGWGAVVNESMNSACAVVANSAIGSVPFLIKDGENGYVYKDKDIDDIYFKIKALLDDPENRTRVAKNAYYTMVDEWNPENAARKFMVLSERMLAGEYKPFPFDDGVCSKAEVLKDGWYK